MERQRRRGAFARCAGAAYASALALGIAAFGSVIPVAAQEEAKPNILFIMGDDIGYMQPSSTTAA